MARVRNKNTGPEMKVRKLVFALGYRYRLHARGIVGKPDLVFARRKKVIFVHGCFWHRHRDKNCKLARLPKSRLEFWEPKLEQNRIRDEQVRERLIEQGWQVLTLWECQLSDTPTLRKQLRTFLDK